MRTMILATLLVLCTAGAARADRIGLSAAQGVHAPLTLTLQEPAYNSDAFRDTTYRRSGRGGVILTDALYGGVAGLVVGAGFALLNDDFNKGGWGRDLAIGAGIGLILGGVVGAVDALGDRSRSL